MPRILIVEDEPAMATALMDGFSFEGYKIQLAEDGEAALVAVEEAPPDLMILDLMLPRKSGLDVCKELRAAGSALPIIMLTARSQELDKVLGLKLGADDYVTKPFSFAELLARVEAVLRRASSGEPAESALGRRRFGDVEVDFEAGTLRRAGESQELSRRELRLLEYFLRHSGQVLSRQQILDAVWDYDTAPITRTVDMHVSKLRAKLEEDPADPRWIVTVHRVGYKFT
ncbi:response regulator transcription factor, partial [bacterium]|nr:response regulator transcription factor [bacterium]